MKWSIVVAFSLSVLTALWAMTGSDALSEELHEQCYSAAQRPSTADAWQLSSQHPVGHRPAEMAGIESLQSVEESDEDDSPHGAWGICGAPHGAARLWAEAANAWRDHTPREAVNRQHDRLDFGVFII